MGNKEGGEKEKKGGKGFWISSWRCFVSLEKFVFAWENVNGLHLEGNSICLKERQLCCQMENVPVLNMHMHEHHPATHLLFSKKPFSLAKRPFFNASFFGG